MNIWIADLDIEKYMRFMFQEAYNRNYSKRFTYAAPEERLFELFENNVMLFDKDEDGKPLADIMNCRNTYAGIVNEKVKSLFETEYCDLFNFFPVQLKELPEEKYYLLSPTVYLDIANVLDMENSDIHYVLNHGTAYIGKIRRYVFTEKVKGYHFFRVKYDNGKYKLKYTIIVKYDNGKFKLKYTNGDFKMIDCFYSDYSCLLYKYPSPRERKK